MRRSLWLEIGTNSPLIRRARSGLGWVAGWWCVRARPPGGRERERRRLGHTEGQGLAGQSSG
eukprot:13380129-Alexandrium_andersonii.AAC.1